MPLATIIPININNVTNLANLLNYDDKLILSLGSRKSHIITPNELPSDFEKWQIKNHANLYAISVDGNTIGSISLSHQNNNKARAGYWLASSERGKGYTSHAFRLIVSIAKDKGFIELSASIDPSNKASIRIRERSGAILKSKGDKISATLSII